MDDLIPLIQRLADGRSRSGTQLARELGISRTAVWKRIQRLERLGLTIERRPGHGYRLTPPLDLLDPHRLAQTLSRRSHALLHDIEIHPSLDSTNERLRRRTPWPGPLACLAEHQHAGRGRRGRRWISPFGANLYLSLAWPFPQRPPALESLGLRSALAVAEALEALGTPTLRLKWPNDLIAHGRKLGGILIELDGEWGGAHQVVIGIGLNVHLPPQAARGIDRPWIDLHTLMGEQRPDRTRLAAAILERLLTLLEQMQHGIDDDWQRRWHSRDTHLGQPVRLLSERGEIHGVHRGIAPDGALLVEHHGICRPYYSGEISLRTPKAP